MTASSQRINGITSFLAHAGWGDACHEPLAADFSPRRYTRLIKPDGARAIMMDADATQKTPEFVALAKILRDAGLHAPLIFSAQPHDGLVVMEDLAGSTFGALLDAEAEPAPLYQRAVDVLVTLHKNFIPAQIAPPCPPLPRFDAALFAEQAALYLDDYVSYATGRDVESDERTAFCTAWREALKFVESLPQSLLLRDFMPDNLIACGDGTTGVLDFQDAGMGSIAYDLASLCEVVRRDGGDAMLPMVLDYYYAAARPACTRHDLERAVILLSAQRHIRILGIVAKNIKAGRTDKASLLPRLCARLDVLMHVPDLIPLRRFLRG